MTRTAATSLAKKPTEYLAGGVVYRNADHDDDEVLRSILRQNSMESWISISTEHEPSYFATTDLFGHRETVVAYKEEDSTIPVGMCSHVQMPVHINGKQILAGYLGELRVLPQFRNRLGIIRNGFKSVRILGENQVDVPYWFTSISSENTIARRILEANLSGMPVYRPLGELATLALAVKSRGYSNVMQQAQLSDIPALIEFYNNRASCYQYSPVLTGDWLSELDGRNGLFLRDFWLLKEGTSVRACFALWDQRKFKQSRVRAYRFPLSIIRRPYNLFANLSGRVVLPAIGEQISYIFVSFLMLDASAKSECRAVIESAMALIKSRNADLAMLGLSTQNPIVSELDPFPKQTYYTCIESVVWQDQADVEHARVDGRLVQPEIAIL